MTNEPQKTQQNEQDKFSKHKDYPNAGGKGSILGDVPKWAFVFAAFLITAMMLLVAYVFLANPCERKFFGMSFGRPCQAVASWKVVDTDGTEDFDQACDYRFKFTSAPAQAYEGFWYYPSRSSASRLVVDLHGGSVNLLSTDKSSVNHDGYPGSHSIVIEARCPLSAALLQD